VKHKRNRSSAGGSSVVRPAWLRLAGAAVLAAALARPAAAQLPAPAGGVPRLPEKSYLTKTAFYLPVMIDERARAGMREVQLWTREGASGEWMLKERAAPSQTGFACRLSQDGEYWFSVVTLDHFGKATPADFRNEPPGVIVVLDTVAPQLDLKALPHSPEGICLRCDVRDSNPNPYSTKLEYQTGDKMWRVCEPMMNQPESFCIPRQAVLTGMVKITCADRAANTTTRECNIINMVMPAGADATEGDTGIVQAAHIEPFGEKPAQQSHYPPLGGPPEAVKVANAAPNDLKLPTADVLPLPPEASAVVATQLPTRQEFNHKSNPGAKWQMVRDPHLSLEYSIRDEGRSGVGKVEVWITKDGGRSWDLLCDDPDRRSPVDFNLPGEGVYGIRLAVYNGRGFGAEPPRPGDAPDYVVELDSTRPHVELLTVKLGPPNESACVEINWLAFDNNFGPDPIDLYYSLNPLGPWTPIAKGVANTGRYRWYLPQQIGRHAYIRVVAKDLAGNNSHCDMTEPLALDDMSRPCAVIVMPMSPGGNTPPTGN